MNQPIIALTRVGKVPVEHYGQAEIHWLASHATNGAKELTVGHTTIAVGGSSPMHRHPNCEGAYFDLSRRNRDQAAGELGTAAATCLRTDFSMEAPILNSPEVTCSQRRTL